MDIFRNRIAPDNGGKDPVKKKPSAERRINKHNGKAMVYVALADPAGYTMGRAARRELARVKKRERRKK